MGSDNVQQDGIRQSYSYSRWRLFFSAFVGFSLFTGVGIFMGWSSPALVLLQPRNFTSAQRSLLASLPGLAPGPLITMFGIDVIGRRYTLLLIWSTLATSWVIMCFSMDIYALIAARFIGGWGMGAAFSAIGIYTSEISDVHVRGPLNSMSMIFVSLGKTVITSVGPFTSLEVMTAVSLAATCIFALFFWFIPESPYHLVNKGKDEEARKVLVWLRVNARKEDIEEELKGIQFIIEEEKANKVGIKKLFTSKAVFKQFGVAWYILYLQQISGMGPVTAYAQTIFESAKLNFKAAYIPIGLSIFGLVAGVPAPFFVKKFGNKILFLVTTYALALGCALIALYFFLLEGGYNVSSITWLPIFATFYLEAVAYSGFGGIIWAVVSDLFAPSVKGYATGICGIFSTILGFVSTAVFGFSMEAYHFGPTFMGFSVLLVISSVGHYFVPNLTHMSLQEIQDYFEGNTKKSGNEQKSQQAERKTGT